MKELARMCVWVCGCGVRNEQGRGSRREEGRGRRGGERMKYTKRLMSGGEERT
jgi:hypothetical protein